MKLWLVFFLLFGGGIVNAQIISTFAGGGLSGTGDGGLATSAVIDNPVGGVFDKFGNFYIASGAGGNRVRKIDASGIISTVAGTGVAGFSGDGGLAITAELHSPSAVILDTFGNLYVLDCNNNRIRKIDKTTGVIYTIAGTGVAASTGNGGPATSASLNNPQDICFDKNGNLYVSELFGNRVRKINTAGVISAFAGNGIAGYSGDGSRADTGKLGAVAGLCVDLIGNVYIADASNSKVFKVNSSGIISTVAGSNTGYLYNGDGILATSSNIDPNRITMDKFGNLYIAEHLNYRVRMVDLSGTIHTVVGNGISGFSGDGGSATGASLSYPDGLAIDSCNNLYISEANNNRVRKVTYPKCNYLGVADNRERNIFSVYPNPANELLNVDIIPFTY